jgi:hypothetical protein
VGGRAPGPQAVTGGEARKTLAAGPQGPLPKGKGCSSEDHLGTSSTDFGLIRSRAIAGKGCIGWG